jgi:hypothetical protein
MGDRNILLTLKRKTDEEPEGEQKRLTDVAHSDELRRMVNRLEGLSMALDGLQDLCGSISGVSLSCAIICAAFQNPGVEA